VSLSEETFEDADYADYADYGEEFYEDVERDELQYDSDVESRFVEREIILLEAGEGRGWWLEWLTGQEDRAKDLEQLNDVLEACDADPRASGLQKIIASKLAKGEGGAIPVFSDQEKDAMIRRMILSESIWYLSILGAIPALWFCRSDWRMSAKIWRVLGAWKPATVLAIFFVASLVGDQLIYSLTYFELYRMFGDDWGLFWTSLVWRGSAAILAAFVLVGTCSGTLRVYFGNRGVSWRSVAGVFCVLAAFEAIRLQLGAESDYVDPNDYILIADPSRFDLFFEFVDSAIFAPVFEELMFRGVLFLGLVRRTGFVPAALVSSILFAVVHTQYDPWELISVGVFGLACCWLTWRTGSLKSSIVLHMVYNALITVGVYLVYQMPL
jgi:membrane protease YdiL (CAAX protease family)